MDFVRARTQEQIISRQDEIINACDQLFSQYGYEGVHFKAISEITSFTRPTIYNYYKTKDEVLLDLLIREMLKWATSLEEEVSKISHMSKDEYSTLLTDLLISHEKMLQLFSILYTVLENNSGIEKLVEFKKKVVKVMGAVSESVDKYFQSSTDTSRAEFVSAFFAYILGLYPMSHLTDKQRDAIKLSGINYVAPDFRTMCYRGILLLLTNL
ncbi:TetR family transcriptional regulator [Anaeromicropila herbilytica]|uniref:HTH tetR-type domain-containing protein n=1 Tax=Anaeromicropila herbilytica TaxID=2785025 RepID=A0A7R7EL75_9FIRM|nr:TetR family transcriptional regulator [Anaeromicropila herbilytica]BCN31075.1 hypothetical protein bsdtb5_23700 [Anaeromicropila herbilytica]